MENNVTVVCSHCKTNLPEAARFCPQCGAPTDMTAWAPGEGQDSFVQGLLNLARGLSSTLDVDALLKRIGPASEQLLLCDASSVMLLDEDKQHLFFKVATGEKGGVITRFKVKIGEGIAGAVAQTREPLLINDVSQDKRFSSQMDQASGFKTKSVLCVPMLAAGDLVGVLEVLNKKTPSGFSESDKNLLESMAGLAGLAIANARVVGGFRNFYSNTIEILISAIEARDMRMAGHCWRVAQRASSVGRKLGLDGQVLKDLYYSALLHDIGFLKVAGGWNMARVLVMESPHMEQTHPLIGADMVRGIDILRGAAALIPFHHECFDGSGFPRGLKGDDIPIGGHVLSVIEYCEEMRMNGYAEEQVLETLRAEVGKKFHPQVAEAYRDVLQAEMSKTGNSL
jgi:HD-GYP domain-containing protein (c-di-GMP phosphodiesterase class II)